VVLAYLVVFLLGGSTLQYLLLRRENAKRLAGKRDAWIAGKSEKEIELLGDRRSVSSLVSMMRRLTCDQAGLHLYIVGITLRQP